MPVDFDKTWLISGVVKCLTKRANQGLYDGLVTPANRLYLDRCTGRHYPTGTLLIFTRDCGMHSSGWWKNPDYERCWHLSISFRDPMTGGHIPKQDDLSEQWVEAFYGQNKRFVWAEPPYSEHGKRSDSWHYRVFCNPLWEPIIPRGEVYHKEFTERGWLSFSDLQHEKAKRLAALEPQPGEQG